jgi:WhiB family redox-sensing transcriptional regulator
MRERQQQANARAEGRERGFDPLVPLFQSEPWVAEAACRDADWEIFFPERGEDSRPAKAVCASCAVRAACLDFALRWSIVEGIWGGLSGRQRRRLAQARRAS